MRRSGILSDGTNFEQRLMTVEQAAKIADSVRGIGQKVVATSGSYDIVHIGHFRYLEAARNFGDFLIVGVDSDAKIRKRKGEDRPIVTQQERLEMLAHLRHVDVLVLKEVDHPKQHFIKSIRPDILVVSERTKQDKDEIEALQEFCGRIEVLPPQAETSTTAQLRLFLVEGVKRYAAAAKSAIVESTSAIIDKLVEDMRGKE